MNKTLLWFYLAAACLLCSCNFSKGVKKDLKTGMYYSYNGFKVGNVVAYNGYGERLTSNKLPEHSTLVFYFDNIENFTLSDKYVYYGCELSIADADGKSIFHDSDLFKNTPGLLAHAAKYPFVKVNLEEPMTAGKTYLVKVRLFDKNSADNEVNVEMEVDLLLSKVSATFDRRTLDFDKYFLITEDNELPENKIEQGKTVSLILSGVRGYTLADGKAFVGCSVLVADKDGKAVLKSDDIFASSTNGYSPKEAEDLKVKITFADPIRATETYHVQIRVFDKKNADAQIMANFDIDVVEKSLFN